MRSATAVMVLAIILGAAGADAACVSPAPVSAPDVQSFNSDPQSLLRQYQAGGAGLVTAVRNLAVSEGSTVGNIASLAAAASSAQRASIGAGLGQAAAICAPRDAPAAQSIQQAIVTTNNSEMTIAFQAVSGDARTTAIGAGAGAGGTLGAGGLNSSVTSTSSGSTFVRTTNSAIFPNSPFSFSPGAGSSVTLQTLIDATGSVSP